MTHIDESCTFLIVYLYSFIFLPHGHLMYVTSLKWATARGNKHNFPHKATNRIPGSCSDRHLSSSTLHCRHWQTDHVCRKSPHRARLACLPACTDSDPHRPRHTKGRIPRSCIRHVLHVDA